MLLLGAVGVGWPAVARAEEPSAEVKLQARKAFERAMAFYQKDEFDKAIEQFESGYKLIPNPLFLYNIGQAHRLSNRPEKALDYYRRYLKDQPDAKNRAEVEGRIAALEKELVPKLPELVVPEDANPGAPEPAPPSLGAGTSLPENEPTAARGGKVRKLLPIILGAAGGAVLLGVVIGVGVYFGTRQSPPTVFEPVTP
jgi:tetratricopeptide (TPR) repeat protein